MNITPSVWLFMSWCTEYVLKLSRISLMIWLNNGPTIVGCTYFYLVRTVCPLFVLCAIASDLRAAMISWWIPSTVPCIPETRPTARVHAHRIWQEHQHTLSIVQISSPLLPDSLFLLLWVNWAFVHNMVWRNDDVLPKNVSLNNMLSFQVLVPIQYGKYSDLPGWSAKNTVRSSTARVVSW